MASAQNIVGKDGSPPPPTDLPHLSLADWGFVDDFGWLLRSLAQPLACTIDLFKVMFYSKYHSKSHLGE